MRTNTRSIATLLVAPLVVSACAGGPAPASAPTPDRQTAAEQSAVIGGATNARPDDERYPITEADVEFMTMMIGHHAQAIVMSEMAPDRARSEHVRTLAARIINGQGDEIRLMQQWLRDHGQPVPVVREDGTVVMPGGHDAHHGSGMAMAGMLTPAQLDELRAAEGTEFDRLYLTSMIRHHRGAVQMVEELFDTPGAGQDETVFRLASDVNVDQITEIRRMQDLLVQLVFES